MVRAPGAGGWQRRPQARADSVLFTEPPQSKRRVFLRRKGLILLRPLNAGRRLFPRKATCGWFWVPFGTKRYEWFRGHSPRLMLLAGCRTGWRTFRQAVTPKTYLSGGSFRANEVSVGIRWKRCEVAAFNRIATAPALLRNDGEGENRIERVPADRRP